MSLLYPISPGLVNSGALDATDPASPSTSPPVPTVGPPSLALVPDALTSTEVTLATGVAWSSSQTSSEATQAAVELPSVSAPAPALAPPLALVPPDAPPTSTAVVTATPPTATRTWKRPPVQWEVIDQFRDFLSACGMQAPANIVSGKWTRILESGADERADVNGSAYTYILNLDKKTPTGTLKTFSGGPPDIFRAEWIEETKPATPRRSKATAAAVRPKKGAAEPAAILAVTERATKLWDEARPVTDEELHPYLTYKRVTKAHGLKINAAGELLVLLRRVEDDVVAGYQHIFPTPKGKKPFDKRVLKSTAPMGAAYRLGEIGPIICIAEGLATAATIREATDWCVFFAYSANNMPNVARAVRERYPTATLVIAADDDCVKAGKRAEAGTPAGQGNVGVTCGRAAARAARAHLAIAPVAGMPEAEAGEWSDWNDLLAVWPIEEIRQRLEAALETPVSVGPDPLARETHIVIGQGAIPQMTETTCEALRAANLTQPLGGLFMMDKEMCCLVPTKYGLSIVPVTPNYLFGFMAEIIRWSRVDARTRSGETVPSDPSRKVVEEIMARKQGLQAPARELAAFVTTPTLRPDGSILTTPGYDEATKLFYRPTTTFKDVPLNPTREDALEALQVLLSPFDEYIFDSGESRSVVLSAILTGVARRGAIPIAPLYRLDAATQSQGKTLLAHVISMCITGFLATVMPYKSDATEMQKQIASIIRAGDPVALFDNVDGTLDDAYLAACVTSEIVGIRTFQTLDMPKVKSTALWLVTSNNGLISEDLAARTYTARIDVKVEAPAKRRFKRADLLSWMRENWQDMLIAALTIQRAYHVAGRPEVPGFEPQTKFPAWDIWARRPLLWLGQPDPQITQDKAIVAAPNNQVFGNFLEAVHNLVGEQPWQAAHLIQAADTTAECAGLMLKPNDPGTVTPVAHAALVDALREIGSTRGHATLNARSLGNWLVAKRDQWSNGYQLTEPGKDSKLKVKVWQVRRPPAPAIPAAPAT